MKDPMKLGKLVWDTLPPVFNSSDEAEVIRMIGEAILAERERCAKIAETFTGDCNDSEFGGPCPCPEEYAKKIRKG